MSRPDPLAVARGLSEAAQLGGWLSVRELADLLNMARGTVRGWSTGHHPRPGYELERRKDGNAVWWRVATTPAQLQQEAAAHQIIRQAAGPWGSR